MQILGLSTTEAVALAARPTAERPFVNNEIFDILLTNQWVVEDPNPVFGTYRSVQNPDIIIPAQLWALQVDQLTLRSVQDFRIPENEGALMEAFGTAWTYLMNVDRFDGPRGNVCSAPEFQFSGNGATAGGGDASTPPEAVEEPQGGQGLGFPTEDCGDLDQRVCEDGTCNEPYSPQLDGANIVCREPSADTPESA